MLIQENVPLAPLTTLGVGGPASYFCEAQSEDTICDAVAFARENELPLFVLGGGSNLVVSDKGFPGLVLKIALHGIEQRREKGGRIRFDVAAGEDWDAFVAHTVEANCAGVECLSGIPGTVGGTPIQNVGAYGQEVSQTIVDVEAIHLASLESCTFRNADCRFDYRSSRFNTAERGEYVITRVSWVLTPGGGPTLSYADLQAYFANASSSPTLSKVREAVREIRHRKAMLIVPGDEDARSAGSFFKNPIVPESKFTDLSARLGPKLRLPGYPAGDGFRKLPAAWLVEHAGFPKGHTKGAVGISRRHALAMVNRGGATAVEIVALKNEIQARVSSEFGIELQPEPVFVGFEANG
jgi:UDP-N-acetylmuramate dehydrogenase